MNDIRENLKLLEKIISILDELHLVDDRSLDIYEEMVDKCSEEYNRLYDKLRKEEQRKLCSN